MRAALAQVLESPEFSHALSHQRLLRYLVELHLAGESSRLKEAVIAIDVFQRPAATFDPLRDSIVRVEARRLRQRLARHYAGSGSTAALRLRLPPGQYVPRIESIGAVPSAAGGRRAVGDARELAERGEFFLRLGHEEGLRKALARFELAVQQDPGLVQAHFGCARALSALVGMTFVSATPAVDQARQRCEQVLQLDPAHAPTLALLAGLLHRFEFDWPGALALYERAHAGGERSAFLHHQWAFSLMFLRRFDEAAEQLRASRALDPLNTAVRAHEALHALYLRDYALAERHLHALLDLQPHALAISLLGYVHLQCGRADDAMDCYRQAEMLFPQLTIGAIGIAQAHALRGEGALAEQTIARLRETRATGYLPPYQLALVAARMGQVDVALSLLARSRAERDSNFVCLPVDPGLDSLRGDERFAALEAECGLPIQAPGVSGQSPRRQP